MNTSESLNEIATALAKAQRDMKPAVKDSINPAFRSKYADLTSVWDAVREPLTTNGISVIQDVTNGDKGISVTTRLLHTSGQWIETGPITVPLSKPDAHGVGSATSYAKRYGLSATVGVVSDLDDDGNAATGKPGVHRSTDGAEDRITEPVRRKVDGIVEEARQLMANGDFVKVAPLCQELDADQMVFFWSQFPNSKERAQLKAVGVGSHFGPKQ